MLSGAVLTLRNTQAADLGSIPAHDFSVFREKVVQSVQAGARLSAFFGHSPENHSLSLLAVLTHAESGTLSLLATEVGDSFPALTPDCPAAHWFEREIAEQWGVKPIGHPWLKPIRFHRPFQERVDVWGWKPGEGVKPGVTEFFRVHGEEIHEVAVGPVHAGVIEPGHFRFNCHGETVLHLEISLGYQHRGVERALLNGPDKRTIHMMETLGGDASIGHAMAYCHAVEALGTCHVPARGQYLRVIALELERLANHTGDLGALAGDIGYLPTASFCGRLRGDFLNLTAQLCGSRFGRGLVRPGGADFDLDPERQARMLAHLDKAFLDVKGAVEMLWDSPSVTARFEKVGVLSREHAVQLGLVGPAARACGLGLDVRFDFPSGGYAISQIPVSTCKTGDVFARAYVRWLEIQRSTAYVRDMLRSLPTGPTQVGVRAVSENKVVVSLVEGWRGEICHVAMTDGQGRFHRYKVVDPSFHNWMGLSIAMRNQQISDFPLCNKSFNLSYCGHDL